MQNIRLYKKNKHCISSENGFGTIFFCRAIMLSSWQRHSRKLAIIRDIIDYSEDKQIPAYIVKLDAEKAFGTVSHNNVLTYYRILVLETIQCSVNQAILYGYQQCNKM